jgi:RimJ/RimL family protein N-acetyltransferase
VSDRPTRVPLPDLPRQIETQRLIIRPHRPGDGRALDEAIRDSLDELRRWPASLSWALAEPSEEASEVFCRAAAADFSARREFPLLLLLRETGEIVGSSGLHRPDWSVPKMEIGWWGRTGYGHQGLITEAVRAILTFGFDTLGARRIYALPDDENTASCKICERVGMQFEGLIRNERTEPDGTLRHTRLYAAIR